MKHRAIFLLFWPPVTLKMNYCVAMEEVIVTKIITVALPRPDLQVFSLPLRSPSLPSCHLFFAGIWEQPHNEQTHERYPLPLPPTHIFKKTWRLWNGVGRPVCKSQLLFYLLHVYFSRERCSFSRAWDHPGQRNNLQTDGLIKWASSGTSSLTSQEIGWKIQSHCVTDPGASNCNICKFWRERGRVYSNP